jgi:uncharacterized protein (DUF983 family)
MSEPTALQTGIFGVCPQCSAPTVFAAPARFADHCAECDLSFAAFNVGDGPAAFLTLIIGAIIVSLALTVELSFQPPFWVHILLWVPITTFAVIFGLRVAKGMLLALEYRNAAREGRLQDDPEQGL